jgi:hypothetical protein
MTTFEDLLIEAEENRSRLRRQKDREETFIPKEVTPNCNLEEIKHCSIKGDISKEITPNCNLEEIKHCSIKGDISKEITSNYDLEEILEARRGGRDREETFIPRALEYPAYFLERYNSSNMNLEGTPKDETYFETSARMILGFQAEPEAVETLREALRQFQEGVSDTQFGAEYLLRFLKQSWVVSDKPAQNRSRSLYNKILGRVVRKQTTTNQPTEQASAQQEQVRELPIEELTKYGLKLDVQLNNSHFGKDFRLKYFDTPFNFCLTYEERLIASVGFVPDEGRIFVEQIQGIKGNHEILSPFKWERALVNYVAEWAQKYGIKQVSVTSVDNNKWAHRHGHLDVEQGRMLYNVTAKRSGFKRGDDGDYHRYFGESQESTIPVSEARQSRELCLAGGRFIR